MIASKEDADHKTFSAAISLDRALCIVQIFLTEPLKVQYYCAEPLRFSIIGLNLFGSSFLDREYFMVQYYW